MNGNNQREKDPSKSWQQAVLTNLRKGGPVCRRAAEYISQHSVDIGFARQSTGAKWTLAGDIQLNPRYYPPRMDPTDPRLLGAVVHEATHLEQGIALALSVEGEVEGWKAESEARRELGAPISNPHWHLVSLTPASPTRKDLRKARAEILSMTGYRYLIWLLPLQPNPLSHLIRWILEMTRGFIQRR